MSQIVYRNISCLITNEGVVNKSGIRPTDADLGLIKNAGVAWSSKLGICWVGKDKDLPRDFLRKSWRSVSCRGLTGYPGLVDPHTHLVFAGDRSLEFSLRMRGASYQEIAAAGGGILTSMRATRKASLSELSDLVVKRLAIAHNFGVRLLEAKSGYGLNLPAELKSLRAMQLGAKKFKKVQVVSTCLAAHAIPPEYAGRADDYVSLICKKILPKVRSENLAEFVDAFCDAGYFSIEQTKRIFSAAKALGFSLRLHGEELALTGAAELAALSGALSVDHLLKISDIGIKKLAASGTVGILLPGTSFYLREPPAPARKLIDQGVTVALATDFNPGTCPTQNLPLIGTIAALQLGMSTAEIISAITWNGAKSLAREKQFGALLPGFRGEPVFVEGDHPSALFYKMAPASLIFPK